MQNASFAGRKLTLEPAGRMTIMPPSNMDFGRFSVEIPREMPSRSLSLGRQETPFKRPPRHSVPDCGAHRAWSWRKRVASAAGRRVRAWWHRSTHPRPSAVEVAVDWLRKHDVGSGLASRAGSPACPGTTAAILPTMLQFGQLDLVYRWCDWLLSTQLPNGSFPRADAAGSSLFNTAQAVGSLVELAAAGINVDAQPARRAADYLAGRLTADSDASRAWCGDGARAIRAAAELCCLPALSAAARQFGVIEWQHVVERVARRLRRVVDWRGSHDSTRMRTSMADAWLALGEVELARDILCRAAALQRRDGGVSADLGGRWGDHAALAHLAVLWYRQGERRRANRALAFLEAHQATSGGWVESWGRRGSARESAWVVKHYLDAVQLQVASSFAADESDLPRTIDSDDGRLCAVYDWMAALGRAPKVADIGCGPGRFLRDLAKRFPEAHLVGIDPSTSLLECLPANVESRHGGLLRIPAADGEFDGVLAVESLEHALLPQQAVREICRVVRPGGRILIIDKHAARQPLSLHEAWERWFLPETVASWMAPPCRDITVRPIAHGPGPKGKGLFLCWQATRCA